MASDAFDPRLGLWQKTEPTVLSGDAAAAVVVLLAVLACVPSFMLFMFLRQHRVGRWPARLLGAAVWVSTVAVASVRLL